VLDGLVVGSVLKATGVCILNIDNWRPNAIFPQIDGFTLVIRRAADVTLMSRPSWWTARRLGWLLAVAVALLAVILVWTRSLGVLAERRGRQLAKEQTLPRPSSRPASSRFSARSREGSPTPTSPSASSC